MKSKKEMQDAVLFCQCQRCGVRLQVGPAPDSKARLLRRSKEPKGFCVNCAVHDLLRNTYPPNIQLAEAGPKLLLIPFIQTVFTKIMKAGFADAVPDEIDWQVIVDNWELPFRNKVKPSASNPCSQEQLDAVAAGTEPGLGTIVESKPVFHNCHLVTQDRVCKNPGPVTSFDELNQIMPGLGDEFRKLMRAADKAGPLTGEIGDAEE